MKSLCPSCRGYRNLAIDSVTRASLLKGYSRASLEVDVSNQIPNDVELIELLACNDCGLRWYSPPVAGTADFYEALQKHNWYYQSEKPEYSYAASQILPESKVLEVGCGRGAFFSYLNNIASYRGIEFNQEAVSAANVAGLDVARCSIEDEALIHHEYYDVVSHFQVLEHVPECLLFMEACVEALKPGGKMIVTVPAEDSFLAISQDSWLNMPPHHVTRWTDKSLIHLFERLGLKDFKIWHEPVAEFHLEWYRQTMRKYALATLFGLRWALSDQSILNRFVSRLAKAQFLSAWLLRRGEDKFQYPARGHSVCIVGSKAMSK